MRSRNRGRRPSRNATHTAITVILDHHTKPDEAGAVFTRVKPKLAVYYRFVLLGTPASPALTEKDVLEMTRRTYDGPPLIGAAGGWREP